jgi:hypothetical protein
MADDPSQTPARREPEPEAIDFDVIDAGGSAAENEDPAALDPAEMLRMGPEMVLQAFRGMLIEKLKRWFIRSLIWGGVLGLLATEHKWARVVLIIWAVIASIHLAFLLFGLYASGRQKEKLMRVFGGMRPPGSGPV